MMSVRLSIVQHVCHHIQGISFVGNAMNTTCLEYRNEGGWGPTATILGLDYPLIIGYSGTPPLLIIAV